MELVKEWTQRSMEQNRVQKYMSTLIQSIFLAKVHKQFKEKRRVFSTIVVEKLDIYLGKKELQPIPRVLYKITQNGSYIYR